MIKSIGLGRPRLKNHVDCYIQSEESENGKTIHYWPAFIESETNSYNRVGNVVRISTLTFQLKRKIC